MGPKAPLSKNNWLGFEVALQYLSLLLRTVIWHDKWSHWSCQKKKSKNYYFVSCIKHVDLNVVITSNYQKKCVSIFWNTLYMKITPSDGLPYPTGQRYRVEGKSTILSIISKKIMSSHMTLLLHRSWRAKIETFVSSRVAFHRRKYFYLLPI